MTQKKRISHFHSTWKAFQVVQQQTEQQLEAIAADLLAKVPVSCEKYVDECCHSWDISAFTSWLKCMAENGYGCDANMHIEECGWEMFGFQNEKEAIAALAELQKAWKSEISLEIEIERDSGEVYKINVRHQLA